MTVMQMEGERMERLRDERLGEGWIRAITDGRLDRLAQLCNPQVFGRLLLPAGSSRWTMQSTLWQSIATGSGSTNVSSWRPAGLPGWAKGWAFSIACCSGGRRSPSGSNSSCTCG